MPPVDAAPLPFFDTHVHFWDPARVDWYPMLRPSADLSSIGLGAATAMKRRYDPATYLAEAGDVEILGVINVTATRGSGNYLGETALLGEVGRAQGLPSALVGGFDPDEPVTVITRDLDEQQVTPILRGVRTMQQIDYEGSKSAEILDAVAERGLVFDVVTHPAQMPAIARRLEARPEATYVIEHTGWPLRADDPAHTAQWRDGMRALAASGPQVYCKLSGLAMTLHTFDVAAMRPWLEDALEIFGVDRCFFGSNFPVDAMFGDLPTLLRAYSAVSAPLGHAAQTQLFSRNAQTAYGVTLSPRR